MMKKYTILITSLMLQVLIINVYGQSRTYTFEVKKTGQGKEGKESIIFIPGFTCSGEVWKDVRKGFESNYNCYTLTMKGFAGVKADANPQLKSWVESLANFIKDNKISNTIIIGHSLGGLMAMWLAANYPELVLKIVDVDALPCYSCSYDSTFKSKENPDCSRMHTMFNGISDDKFLATQKMTTGYLVADTSKIEMIAQWAVHSDRNTMAEIFCQFMNTDIRTKLPNIKCPALILLESNFKQSEAIAKQYKNLKTAQLQYATKGLHFIMYDDKEWLDKRIADFIK